MRHENAPKTREIDDLIIRLRYDKRVGSTFNSAFCLNMRHENAPKNREIFDKLEEAGRLRYERGMASLKASFSEADEAALMIGWLATEITEGPAEAAALLQAVEILGEGGSFNFGNRLERIHKAVVQSGHIRELAALYLYDSSFGHDCRLDTLAMLIKQHDENPDFVRLLDVYLIDAKKAIKEDRETVKADSATLYRISNIAEKILIDFGEEYHNRELLCWGTDVDPPTMQWPLRPVSGKFSRFSIRKWLPSFYKEGKKQSYGCHIHYHTKGKSTKNESQILLPPDISDSDGAELRLWDEHAIFDYTRLLSEPDAQSLLADLDQLYKDQEQSGRRLN